MASRTGRTRTLIRSPNFAHQLGLVNARYINHIEKASREIYILTNLHIMKLPMVNIGQGSPTSIFPSIKPRWAIFLELIILNNKCSSIVDKVNHLSFDDFVTMDEKGLLKNGIEPAACICKQLNSFAYFILITLTIFAIGLLSYFCSCITFISKKALNY